MWQRWRSGRGDDEGLVATTKWMRRRRGVGCGRGGGYGESEEDIDGDEGKEHPGSGHRVDDSDMIGFLRTVAEQAITGSYEQALLTPPVE
ncbi:hypothetical protein Droror1_Dr00027657, partial [Drosera rotundifolia]